MKKIILLFMAIILYASNWVVLDVLLKNEKVNISDSSKIYRYNNAYYTSDGYEVIKFDNNFNKIKEFDQEVDLIKLNNHLYAIKRDDKNGDYLKNFRVYKIYNNSVKFYKLLHLKKSNVAGTIHSNNRYLIVAITSETSNTSKSYIYIYNRKFQLIKRLSFDGYAYVTQIRGNDVVYELSSNSGDNDYQVYKYNIITHKIAKLANHIHTPFAYLGYNNNLYYSTKNNTFYKIENNKKICIAHQPTVFALENTDGDLMGIWSTKCFSDNYCEDNYLVFDTTKDAFIRNLLHASNSSGHNIRFDKINNYLSMIYMLENTNSPSTYVNIYKAVDLDKAPKRVLKSLKPYFIKTIEHKINKKLSKNAKVVVLRDNKWTFEEQGANAYCSIPFIVKDNNKIYAYMNMSFTSHNGTTANFTFNGKYKLLQHDKLIVANHVYAPYQINNHNEYLGYNPVFEFSDKFRFKKGMKFKFIENDGRGGALYFDLSVKDMF